MFVLGTVITLFCSSNIWMSYSPINFSTSSSTSVVGTLTSPVFETRYLLSKFHPGSELSVASRRCFQTPGAVSPTTLSSLRRIPGNFCPAANAAISSSEPNSCPPNSCEGKARICSCESSYFSPSAANLSYSRWVKPHCEATFVAYTTLPCEYMKNEARKRARAAATSEVEKRTNIRGILGIMHAKHY